MDHGGQIWTPTNKHRTSFQRRHDETPELTAAGTPELKALVSPFGHSVSQRQSRPRGRQTTRAMGRSPRNVCEKLRHSDTSQRGTETSM